MGGKNHQISVCDFLPGSISTMQLEPAPVKTDWVATPEAEELLVMLKATVFGPLLPVLFYF